MELSDFEVGLDKHFVAHSPRLIVARVDTSSVEEEEMALNPQKGLKDLVARRKGSSSKDAPKVPLPPNPALPPLLSPLDLLPDQNLQKKKRKGKEIEEREIVPSKDPKQQKTNRDRQRETLVESREDSLGAEVCRMQCT